VALLAVDAFEVESESMPAPADRVTPLLEFNRDCAAEEISAAVSHLTWARCIRLVSSHAFSTKTGITGFNAVMFRNRV
jgi:hypothetical protein